MDRAPVHHCSGPLSAPSTGVPASLEQKLVEALTSVASTAALVSTVSSAVLANALVILEEEDDLDMSFLEEEKKSAETTAEDDRTANVIQDEAREPIRFVFGDAHVSVPSPSERDEWGSISLKIWSGSFLVASQLSADMLRGATVLELGCGRALAGLAAAKLGAKRVVMTDCDDRALRLLLPAAAGAENIDICHFLWETDEKRELEGLEACAPRHWSDAYRCNQIPDLDVQQKYDLILASDCLYFSSQELPLAAVLRTRMQRPHGRAIICHQRRGDGAFLLSRLQASLADSGMHVQLAEGPWQWPELLDKHLVSKEFKLAYCVHDNGPHCMLQVTWK